MNKKVLRNRAYLMSHSFNRTKMFHSKRGWMLSSALFLATLGTLMGAGAVNKLPQQTVAPINDVVTKANNLFGNITANADATATSNANQSSQEAHPASSTSQSVFNNASPANAKSVAPSASNQASGSSSANSVNSSSASKVNNQANGNQTVAPSSASAKSSVNSSASNKPAVHMLGGGNPLETPKPKSNQQTTPFTGKYTPGTLRGMNYKYYKDNKALEFTNGRATNDLPWMYYVLPQKDIEYIKFDNIDASKVTDIDNMFNNDTNLKYINLSGLNNINNIKNMSGLFMNDTNLQTIIFPTASTYNVTDMSTMFQSDKSLHSLTLPKSFDTSNVRNMSHMFANDYTLQSLDLSNAIFNTSKVNKMQNMFQHLFALKSLNLPSSFDTSNVSDMSWMFSSDRALSDLTLPNSFNTKNVTNMVAMFLGNWNMKQLNLDSNFNTHKVSNMSSMFSDEHSLKSLMLPNAFDTSSVIDMDHMFDSDYALSDLTLPNAFKTNGVSNMYMMFINMGKNNPNGVNINLGNEFNTTDAINNNVIGNYGYSDKGGNLNGLGNMFQNAKIRSITMPSTAKFNTQSQLGNNWYQVASNQNGLEKDKNGNYYTIPNAPKTNLMNSNSYGTWVQNPNAATVSTTYAFYDNNHNLIGSPITVNGKQGTIYDVPSYKIPQGWTFANNIRSFTFEPNAVSGITIKQNNQPMNHQPNNDIPVSPKQQHETVNYMNGNTKVASDAVSGNDSSANGASDTTFDTTSKLPNYYHLSNGQSATVNYDGNNHNIMITPNQLTDTINYQLGGQTKTTQKFTGNDSRAAKANDTTFTVNSTNDSNIPKGYELSPLTKGESNTFNYDGGTHNVAIQATNQTANVDYELPNGLLSQVQISGDVGSSTTPTIPKGYYAIKPVTPYTFEAQNANDNPDDVINIAPVSVNGTATIHIKYDLGNNHVVKGNDQTVNINGQYNQSDMVINPVNYQPDNYSNANNPFHISFKNFSNLSNNAITNYKPSDTFTYKASEAPSLVIRYDNVKSGKTIHSDTFTPSQLGVKAQDWVLGRTFTFGTKGTNNAIDVITAPTGYNLDNSANGYKYQNGKETITLESTTINKGTKKATKAVLMAMPMFDYHNNNKPVSPAKPSSASVTPTNNNSGSASVVPSSTNSVVPSSASQSTSTSTTSTNNSDVLPSSNSSVNSDTNPVISTPTSASNASTNNGSNSDTTILPSSNTNHSIQPSSDNTSKKNSDTSDSIQTNSNIPTTNVTKSNIPTSTNIITPNTNSSFELPNTPITINPSEPINNAVSVPSIQSNSTNSNTTSKLPQTNEANNYVGIMALATSILSLGLAGVDLKRKYSL